MMTNPSKKQVKQVTLAYKQHGNKRGPLMIFLHGGGVSSWMWEKQIEHFTNYHCVTVDLPEHGESKDSEPFSISYSAEKINGLIEDLATDKKVIVIGFSLGAQVAVKMMSLKPDLIDYAILNSTLLKPPSELMRKMMRQSLQISYPMIKNRTFAKLQARTLHIGEEYFDTYFVESSQLSVDTLIRIFDENMSFALPENFGQVKTKMLATVGSKENALMKKSLKLLVKNHPNCTGIIIPKVGHGIPFYDPDYFNRLVESWLKDGTLPEDVWVIE